MLFLGCIYIALGPWYFGYYLNVFLPNTGEDQKKVLPSKRGAPRTAPYGKSGPDRCITFIKRLDKDLR